MRIAVALAALLLLTAGAQARTIGGKAVENHIRPTYERLAAAMDGLSKAATAFCDGPQKDRRALDAAFSGAVIAWSGAEHLRFGPITEQNRYERIAFWPDPKGLGLKQVAAELREKDAAITTPEGLAKKSVALQGLTAFEALFWSEDAQKSAADAEGRAFRCGYAKAIAANLSAIAAAVRDAWMPDDGFAAQFTAPGEGKLYRTDVEVTLEIFKAFRTSLQQTRTAKLNRVLMGNAEEAQPRRAAYWRSGNEIGVIAANLAAVKEVYQKCGLYEIVHATGHGIDQSTLDQFHLIEEALDKIKGRRIADITATQQSWAQLNSVVFGMINIQLTGGNAIAEAAELPMSFNSLDGD